MLMYVARSMNLWASTDMRLTISPTVEDFLAELVITKACRERRGEEGECGSKEPGAPRPGPCGGRRWLRRRNPMPFLLPFAALSVFPAHLSHRKAPAVTNDTH